MAKKEANIVVRLRDRASSGFRKLTGAVGKLLKPIALVTSALGGLASLAGGAFLVSAIRNAGSFGEQLSILGGLTQATAEEMAALEEAARTAGATTRFSATEAGQGLEELARAGQSAGEAIATLNPVLDLAAGNNQTVAQSAIQVTTALNAFGLEAADAARVSDVFTRAAQKSAQTTSQLGEAMTFVAPVARQAGLEIEETAALIGRLADAGFRGSLGGTALRNAILQFQDPASNFNAELQKIGITSDSFVGALEQMAEAGDGAEAAIRSLGLRAGPAIQAIVSGGAPALRELTEELNNAEGASEAAAKALEDNLPGAFRNLKSAFSELQIVLAQPLTEEIKDSIFDLADVIRNFAASDTATMLADVLVETFRAARESVVDFVKSIDFEEAKAQFEGLISSTRQFAGAFNRSVGGIRGTVDKLVGSVQVVVGIIGTVFNSLGVVIAGRLAFLGRAISRFLVAMDRLTLGTIDALSNIQGEVEAITASMASSAEDFSRKTGNSVARVVRGWQNLTDTVEDSASRQQTALDSATEAQERNTEAVRKSAEAEKERRERIERSLAAVRSWEQATEESSETARQAQESTEDFGEAVEEAGDKQAEAGEKAEEAGEKQEEAAESAKVAWLDFGDGIEAVSLQVEELAGTAQSLDQLRAQAEAATPPIDRLSEAIAAASSTSQLDLVVQSMSRLREEGVLTEAQYQRLTEAVLEQAEALREATVATDDQAASLNQVSREAASAATSIDAVGQAASRSGSQARSSALGFGAILDSWRELGPEASAEVDRFIEQTNRIPVKTFASFSRRLARFTDFMKQKFGTVADAAREARQETDDFERSSGGSIGGGNVSLSRQINISFEVVRDPQGPLQLSESDLSRLAGLVVQQIENDGDRT